MSEEDDTRKQVEEQANEDLDLEGKDAAGIGGGDSSVSTTMKAKHDTVKNSISNIR